MGHWENFYFYNFGTLENAKPFMNDRGEQDERYFAYDGFHISHAGFRVYLNRWAVDHPDIDLIPIRLTKTQGGSPLASVVFTEP